MAWNEDTIADYCDVMDTTRSVEEVVDILSTLRHVEITRKSRNVDDILLTVVKESLSASTWKRHCPSGLILWHDYSIFYRCTTRIRFKNPNVTLFDIIFSGDYFVFTGDWIDEDMRYVSDRSMNGTRIRYMLEALKGPL
jgi:hypothetical protein